MRDHVLPGLATRTDIADLRATMWQVFAGLTGVIVTVVGVGVGVILRAIN
jgi:hypothetical protein